MDIQVLASSSRGNCYRISDGTTPLLLDCGLPLRVIMRKLNYQLKDIKGCLLSHEHSDHSKGVYDLLSFGMDVYMSQGTKVFLGLYRHNLKVVTPKTPFNIGTFKIMPFVLQHDAAEPLGYLLQSTKTGEKLLFVTDTYYIKYKFTGLTHILVECNYAPDILEKNRLAANIEMEQRDRLIESHLSLDNLKEFLSANDMSKVQEIHLLHLSDLNSDENRFKQEIMALTGKPVYIAKG